MAKFDTFGNELKRVAFNAVSTKTAIVPAVTGKEIHVLDGQLTLSAAGTALWERASTAISGTMSLASGTPVSLAGLATAAGEALNLTCVTGTGSGWLEYVET